MFSSTHSDERLTRALIAVSPLVNTAGTEHCVTDVTAARKARRYLLFIEARPSPRTKRSNDNDQVLQPDVGGDAVGPDGLRDVEPSRADGGLTSGASAERNDMTKFYALLAAIAIFAPVAFATINQAALVIA
jgi:hypothetical protein